MPGLLNLPDDSQVALSAQVKDEAGYVDPSAVLVWSTTDPGVVSLDATSGDTVTASAAAGPGTTADVGLLVQDSSGQPINGPDGNPLADTLSISIVSSDLSVSIAPGAVSDKPVAPAPAPAPGPTPPDVGPTTP